MIIVGDEQGSSHKREETQSENFIFIIEFYKRHTMPSGIEINTDILAQSFST